MLLLLLLPSQDGGAIYQKKWATFVFNSFVTFQENSAWNVRWGKCSSISAEDRILAITTP